MRNEIRYDGESDVALWLVGSGVALIQACALFPGLLPFLLLLLPFVLPFVALGLAAAVPIGLPIAVWRLITWAWRVPRRRHATIPYPATAG